MGRVQDAVRIHEDATERLRSILGESHKRYHSQLYALAGALSAAGRFEEAAGRLEQCKLGMILSSSEKSQGRMQSPDYFRVVLELAAVRLRMGEPMAALELGVEARDGLAQIDELRGLQA